MRQRRKALWHWQQPNFKEDKKMQARKNVGQILIKYRTILILVVLTAVFTILKPIFVDPTNLLNMMKRMSYVAIAAYAMTFLLTLGVFDLSSGSMAAMVGVTLAFMLSKGIPLGIALAGAVVLSILLGFLNGFISVKGKINAFLVTLATMNIYRGIALTVTSGRTVSIKIKGFTDFFGNGTVFNTIPTPVIIMAVFFIACWFLYRRTKFGFYCKCIGGNLEAAKVAGIKSDKIIISAFALNGLLCCFAGFILASLMNAGVPDIGSDLSMDAISAAVLGGTAIAGGIGTMWGTVGGTFIMGILNAGLSLLGAQSPTQILVKGIVIILAVLMDNALKNRTMVTSKSN